MPATLSFSLKQARRLALAAQGFNGRQPPTVKAPHINRLIERLGLRRYPSRALWPRAWELRTNLTAYDALYVALAEQLDAPLLTADARLARAPGLRCSIEIVER